MPMAHWELEVIRRSLAMSPSVTASTAERLLAEIERLHCHLDCVLEALDEACAAGEMVTPALIREIVRCSQIDRTDL